MKKLTALLLALVMVLAIGSTAMASGIPENGVQDNSSSASATKITFNIYKEIKFYNAETSSVYEPAVTYTYQLAPATETVINTAQIKDKDGVVAGVKPGVADGAKLNTASVAFAADVMVESVTSEGKSVKKPIEIEVDPSKFSQPGVYRYVIEETDPIDLDAKGVVTATDTNANIRYLDVYIQRNNTTNAMEVYGYVLFKSTVDKTLDASDKNPATADLDEKTDGFTDDDDTKDDANVDTYTTYNLEVKKTITGAMGDTSHEFPFTINLTGSVEGAKFTVDEIPTTVGNGGAIEVTKGLANNDTVKIVGVPQSVGATLAGTVKEENDTQDVYTPSIVTADTKGFYNQALSLTGSAEKFENGVTETVSFNLNNAKSDAETELSHITINNDLPAISPTGVVLRVAPYAIMLGAGVALFIVLKLRKNKAAEA